MIRLHHVAQARSFRCLWLLHEIGAEFELVRHAFGKALRDADFTALSPASRIPALEIDGRALFESGAIAEYLVESRAPHLGRGPGDVRRGDYLEWLHFGETIGQHLANLTQQHIVLREDVMRSPTVMRLEAKRLSICLEAVATQAQTQAGTGFLAGDFSAADVQCGYGLWLGRRFCTLSPRAQAYLDHLTERPAFQSALAEDGAKDGPANLYTRDFYPAPEA